MASPPGGKADYVLIGSPRGDTLYGDRYRPNFIFGGQGDDYAYGGSGQDTIYGASGNDRFTATAATTGSWAMKAATSSTAAWAMTICSVAQATTFSKATLEMTRCPAGLDTDTFYYFSLNEGHDVITDFNVKQDKILLDGFGFANVKAGSIQVGSDVLIRTSDEGSILLQHVKLNQLTDDMFI